MSGKGDTPRPLSVDYQQYLENMDRTFGTKRRRIGRIYGSCGHDISEQWDAQENTSIVVARLDREGLRVASYEEVCPECRFYIVQSGAQLENQADIDAWLKGEKYCIPW
jgi:hypothetical protein